MRLPRPRSLSGQALLVLFAGLAFSHLVGFAIYTLDRQEAVLTDEAVDVAERVVGVVQLLQKLPDEWRGDIVRGFDGRTLAVALGAAPTAVGEGQDDALAAEVARFLYGHLPEATPGDLLVRLSRSAPAAPLRVGEGPEDAAGAAEPPRAGGSGRRDRLQVSARLDDGRWLNFAGALPRPDGLWPGAAGAYILSVALGVGALTMWLVARVTAPLSALARAAERFGKNIRAEPLPEGGPTEVVQAARALNEMQERLRRLVENRTQMMAAISHDLRTPVTVLRLRAELMAEGDERTKVLDTLDEMEAMIASVLEFARGTYHDEPQRQVDLSALVESLCEDMAEAGAAVTFDPPERVPIACRRTALKRALANLIDNAVKYGRVARVAVRSRAEAVEITIDDEGPGIPPDQLDRVFLPFYRVDGSRTPGRGGVGLGLSTAQAIIHGHGGTLIPENRPHGGLRVRVCLPR